MAARTSTALQPEAREAAGCMNSFNLSRDGYRIAASAGMNRFLPALLLLALLAPAAVTKQKTGRRPVRRVRPSSFDVAAINDSSRALPIRPNSSGSAVVRAQILLDRAHFSCGEIDGSYGHNLETIVRAYQQAHGLGVTGAIGPELWTLLNADQAPALLAYTIAPEDVAGPFEKIPEGIAEKEKLKAMNYESALEGISEKFHVSPGLLMKLNPGKRIEEAGMQIQVPNVITAPLGKAVTVVVNAKALTVEAHDINGKTIASYAASVGSEHDPLPVGDWKVSIIQKNPIFFYNSDLFWDANEQHAKAKIPPGPNNSVGVVWIGLTKEHYGIHGTPEPQSVGHTQSHGCIRLTNWDASELAQMVDKGTAVVLKD